MTRVRASITEQSESSRSGFQRWGASHGLENRLGHDDPAKQPEVAVANHVGCHWLSNPAAVDVGGRRRTQMDVYGQLQTV